MGFFVFLKFAFPVFYCIGDLSFMKEISLDLFPFVFFDHLA
jgi:hypothetical protein